jgi:malonyl-CoA O-methyltransferase
LHESFSLDTAALRRSFDRAARTFDASAALHAEVRQRALERLTLLRSQPELIVDLGSGTGAAGKWFRSRVPSARIVEIDRSLAMLRESRRKQGAWQRLLGAGPQQIGGDAARIPLRDGSADWVFASLLLPWCALEDTLAQIKRVLKPGGVFAFTSFGPDTLIELRQAWHGVDRFEHVHAFVDMHDLGDALVRAGFAEPVLDVERFTLTYRSFDALLRELKATGSRNAWPNRARGLTTRGTLDRVATAYERHRREDQLPATFEVVYGQAWQSATAPKTTTHGEVRVPLDSLQRRR